MSFCIEHIQQISDVLSKPRFSTYLEACDGDEELAFALYQWNLEVSTAFMVPLHVFEVTLRNAVVECLESVHRQDWPWQEGLLRSLKNPARRYSARRDLDENARAHESAGKIVADLKFVFWEKMLTASYDTIMWQPYFRKLFPYAPKDRDVIDLRTDIHDITREIRIRLRNRIAHHEPIYGRDLVVDYQNILRVIAWRSDAAGRWVDGLQRVGGLLVRCPVALDGGLRSCG